MSTTSLGSLDDFGWVFRKVSLHAWTIHTPAWNIVSGKTSFNNILYTVYITTKSAAVVKVCLLTVKISVSIPIPCAGQETSASA